MATCATCGRDLGPEPLDYLCPRCVDQLQARLAWALLEHYERSYASRAHWQKVLAGYRRARALREAS